MTAASELRLATAVESSAMPTSWLASLTWTRLLTGFVAAATVLVVGGLATVLFSGSEAPTAAGQPSAPSPSNAASTTAATHPSTAVAATASTGASSPPSSELPQEPIAIVVAKPAVSPEGGTETELPDTAAPAPTLTASTAHVSDASNDPVPLNTAAAEPSTASPLATQPVPSPDEGSRAPVLKFDPLGFDPTQLSLESIAAAAATPADSVSTGRSSSETDAPAVANNEPLAEELLQPPAEQPAITVRLGPLVGSAPAPLEIVEALSLRVDAFSVSAMPLDRFVAVVSDMLGIPITLEPITLELAGTVPSAPVTVNATQQSLEQLLHDVLAKHRLALCDVAGHLSIQLASADDRSTKVHDVSDLVAVRAKDAAEVAATIERFVSPGTWVAAGGVGKIQAEGRTLRVEQSKAVQHEVFIFCERLRLARGVRQQTRYPADRLAIDSPYVALTNKLSERTTFTFLPWTRLADVVRHWQLASGVIVLVDWSSLASEELVPSTPMACSAVDQPWGDALDQILEPLELVWWAVDGRTIQITTRGALADIRRTEFHAIPQSYRDQFASEAGMIDSLRAELQRQFGENRADNRQFQLQYDEPSRHLVMHASPQLHQLLTQLLHGLPREPRP